MSKRSGRSCWITIISFHWFLLKENVSSACQHSLIFQLIIIHDLISKENFIFPKKLYIKTCKKTVCDVSLYFFLSDIDRLLSVTCWIQCVGNLIMFLLSDCRLDWTIGGQPETEARLVKGAGGEDTFQPTPYPPLCTTNHATTYSDTLSVISLSHAARTPNGDCRPFTCTIQRPITTKLIIVPAQQLSVAC